MGRLLAALAPFMLCAPDEIVPGGSAAPGAPPGAPPASGVTAAASAAAPAAAPARTTVDQLPPEALSARLRANAHQARKAVLDELGIDDPAKFKAEREAERRRLAELEQAQEEKRRSEMSEVERLKADVAAKDARIAELEAQLTRAHGDAQATKFDVIVSRTIGEHVDPSMHEDAQAALMRHLRTLPKDQVRKFGEPETRTFFAKLVKDKPKYAKDAAAPPKAPAAPPRRPLSNGAPPKGATPPGPAKTPGNGMKPASQMTKTELRAAWEKYGARAPG